MNINEYLYSKLKDILNYKDIKYLATRYTGLKASATRKNITFTLTPAEYFAFLLQTDFIAKLKTGKVEIVLKDKSLGYRHGNLEIKSKDEDGYNYKHWLVTFKNGDIVIVKNLRKFIRSHKYFNCTYENVLYHIHNNLPVPSVVITSIKQIPENKV